MDFKTQVRPSTRTFHGNADPLSRTSCAQYGRPMKSNMCAVRATQSASAIVAQTLRDQLLAVRYAGRLCKQRTLSRTKSRFYWPGMSGDVHLWCRTCTQSAARKRPSKNSRALMQPMTAGYPLQRLVMDILGPL
ncbi:hypothetical protein T03_18109 [Trichinella britovi]|uniref:Integrase zinc-binding domain-containing protein n=1 Tax=Trichinella britovi TaxID=45882 RepID=A0A0V1AKB0_TRIBR|nr:hypothetical protein T03_18109 [Trichinella britovi]